MERYFMHYDYDRGVVSDPHPAGDWVDADDAMQLFNAFQELVEWSRDIAGDCECPKQRKQECEMMERMDSILAKHRHPSGTEFEEALATDNVGAFNLYVPETHNQ